jgi:hypothetical protein
MKPRTHQPINNTLKLIFITLAFTVLISPSLQIQVITLESNDVLVTTQLLSHKAIKIQLTKSVISSVLAGEKKIYASV